MVFVFSKEHPAEGMGPKRSEPMNCKLPTGHGRHRLAQRLMASNRRLVSGAYISPWQCRRAGAGSELDVSGTINGSVAEGTADTILGLRLP